METPEGFPIASVFVLNRCFFVFIVIFPSLLELFCGNIFFQTTGKCTKLLNYISIYFSKLFLTTMPHISNAINMYKLKTKGYENKLRKSARFLLPYPFIPGGTTIQDEDCRAFQEVYNILSGVGLEK